MNCQCLPSQQLSTGESDLVVLKTAAISRYVVVKYNRLIFENAPLYDFIKRHASGKRPEYQPLLFAQSS